MNVLEAMSMPYREYLKTEHWKDFREHVFEVRGRKCEDCGAENVSLHVHHENYEWLGEERLEDVRVLCRNCHKLRHFDWLRRECKHKKLYKSYVIVGGRVDFYYSCIDCFSFVAGREPDAKEKKFAEKEAEKYKIWLEKEAIKQAIIEEKQKEKLAKQREKEKLNPKPKKKKKRKPYKKRVKKDVVT